MSRFSNRERAFDRDMAALDRLRVRTLGEAYPRPLPSCPNAVHDADVADDAAWSKWEFHSIQPPINPGDPSRELRRCPVCGSSRSRAVVGTERAA